MDQGGYVQGQYFGHTAGTHIFHVWGDDEVGSVDEHVRARTAKEARLIAAKNVGVTPSKHTRKFTSRRRPRSKILLARAENAERYAQSVWSRAVGAEFGRRRVKPGEKTPISGYAAEPKFKSRRKYIVLARRALAAWQLAADAYEEYGDLKKSLKMWERADQAARAPFTRYDNGIYVSASEWTPKDVHDAKFVSEHIKNLKLDIKNGRRDPARDMRRKSSYTRKSPWRHSRKR